MSGDGAEVSDLRLESSTGPRLSSYDSASIAVVGATNFALTNLTVKHSGFHITGSSNGLVANNTLEYTAADSIHMSNQRGANQYITVRNNDISHPHDDGVAVVSYGGSRSGNPASHHILIENNSVTDQEWGRGYTVVGGHDVTIRDNFYDGNTAGGAGIYIASEGAYETLPVNNVYVEDNLIKNAGGKKHAAIQVYAGNKSVTNVHIEDNVIYASKAGSVVTNGSGGARDIYIKDNVSYGPAKGATDFVGQLNGTQTIESNNKILPKSAYPGDKAFDVGGASGAGSTPVTPMPPAQPEVPVPNKPEPTIPGDDHTPPASGTPDYKEGAWTKIALASKMVSGSSKGETLNGSDASEVFKGNGGDDTMIGGKGHDTFYVDSAGDKVVEKSGSGIDQVILSISKYVLPEHVQNLSVVYQGGANVTGNAMDNIIIGGKGNDVIDGGAGKDLLTGGAGNDNFVFHKGHVQGDQITDFIGNGAKAGDVLRFEGFGKGATLTHEGDIWTVRHADGAETFKLVGVNELAFGDAVFA